MATNVLDANNLSLYVRSNGQFTPSQNGASLVLNSAIERSLMYAGGLWMSGMDPSGGLHVAVHKYGADGHDFYPGPLTVGGDASISPEMMQQYDQVWRISRNQLEEQQAYFECVSDPNCDLEDLFPSGYTIPDDFMTWPAMGNIDEGQELYLAPFADPDQDNVYDPTIGDRPCVAGDVALFTIFNDKGGPHFESGGLPLGIEVHMMPFAYTSGNEDLWNTLFVHYKLINRSSVTYSNFKFGIFSDLDAGCAKDDLVGTDVGRNMVYAYNMDDMDEDCLGTIGFGDQPPAAGMMVLKGLRLDPNGTDDEVINSLPSYNGSAFGDGFADNERCGLTGSMHFRRGISNPMVTDPYIDAHFYRYLNMLWTSTIPLTYGDLGYSSDPAAIPSAFSFPGESDPYGVGTNGEILEPWYDSYSELSPDPRILAILGPITLEPSEYQEILIAYIYARADEGGALASVAALQQRADNVRAFAQNIPGLMAAGSLCDEMPVGIAPIRRPTALAIYPNPAHDLVTVVLDEKITNGSLEVFDVAGRTIMELPVSGPVIMIPIEELTPGSYHLRFVESGSIHSGRFIKE